MTQHTTTQHQPAMRGAVAWAALRSGPAVTVLHGTLNPKAPAAVRTARPGIGH